MDSCFAAWMKPQVLTRTTAASSVSIGELPAAILEPGRELFRIDLVAGAAERHHPDNSPGGTWILLTDRPARPWLFAVARNLAVDSYRARQARPPETAQAALELLPADDNADRTLESWAVADALASLRPDHRRVIIETYYRGCSVAEAAATLGIPPGTVKSRTFYALKALKLALQERGLAP